MNKSEFTNLPASVALGLLWDNSAGIRNTLENIEAPKPALPPRFDSILYRKEGVMWASECDLESLRFWHSRSVDSAAKGGQYASNDEKRAKALSFWIAWREQNPGVIWSGERNREPVTAAAPRAKPTVYPRDAKPTTNRAASSYDYDDNTAGNGAEPDDDYGF